MKFSRSPTEFDQNNPDVTSIPGYEIKKNSIRGVKHGLLKDKRCTTRRDRCSKKAREEKYGCHPTIRSRWYADEEYRKSLSARGLKEDHKMLHDRNDVEKRKDLSSHSNQRPDFAQARRKCKRLHDEHLARTQLEYRDVLRSQQRRQRKGHQFEGNEDCDFVGDPKTGWRFYKQSR